MLSSSFNNVSNSVSSLIKVDSLLIGSLIILIIDRVYIRLNYSLSYVFKDIIISSLVIYKWFLSIRPVGSRFES
jgi:hypothetical protein